MAHLDAIAVPGFPLDWNHWFINEWPARLEEIRTVLPVGMPLWVSEVGVSTCGAEELQEFGLRRTAELLAGRVPRVHRADSCRPDALNWFARQMTALEDFTVTVTFCFTSEHLGLAPPHTSPPRKPQGYADFCAEMVHRYAR